MKNKRVTCPLFSEEFPSRNGNYRRYPRNLLRKSIPLHATVYTLCAGAEAAFPVCVSCPRDRACRNVIANGEGKQEEVNFPEAEGGSEIVYFPRDKASPTRARARVCVCIWRRIERELEPRPGKPCFLSRFIRTRTARTRVRAVLRRHRVPNCHINPPFSDP